MREIFTQLSASPLLIGLAIALFISNSVTTFDKRIIQAKRSGALPPDHANLPRWVSVFHLLDWAIFITILIFNWKVGILIWVIYFILKVLPVFETIGNILMAPFKSKGTDHDKTL